MRTFRVDRRPYDEDVALYDKSTVSFSPGLTVLVGCNGSGKSTLLMLLKDQLREDDSVLMMEYDDRYNGGTNRIGELMFHGNTTAAANMFCSSEGERIQQSVGYFVSRLGKELRSKRHKEVWVLLDAVSSGLSIDNAVEIKEFVQFVQGENPGTDIYFVVSTNEYEFASGTDCINVTSLRHRRFRSYNDYRKFILKTREIKDRR